jgi:hypothetical protein
VNTPEWREAEIPAANGHATAAAIADAYRVFLDGGERAGKPLLSAAGTDRIRQGQGAGVDLVLSIGMAGLDSSSGWASSSVDPSGPTDRTRSRSGTTAMAARTGWSILRLASPLAT